MRLDPSNNHATCVLQVEGTFTDECSTALSGSSEAVDWGDALGRGWKELGFVSMSRIVFPTYNTQYTTILEDLSVGR